MEVKTGDAEFAGEQVGRYLDHARAQGYAGVLTISNRITASPIDAAVEVDRRKLRNLNLWHLSWWRILTEAVVQHRHRGVSDLDQAWILGALIAERWEHFGDYLALGLTQDPGRDVTVVRHERWIQSSAGARR